MFTPGRLRRPRRFQFVRALGQLLQERVCFSHNIQRSPGSRQLGLELRVPSPKPFQLGGFHGPLRPFPGPPRIGHSFECSRIACTGPLDHMRRIQPLSTQNRTLLAVRRLLILRDDRQLVGRTERTPRRTRRRTAGRPRPRRRGRHVPPPAGAPPRSSVDTNTRTSDHALYREALTSGCLTRPWQRGPDHPIPPDDQTPTPRHPRRRE